jgi:GNAT superfamily N-acetyltransferase
MNHNPPYLVKMVEGLGFTKEVDFISCYGDMRVFRAPERVHRIAQRTLDRGIIQIKHFTTIKELKAWSGRVGDAYNRAFVNNWEYAPLTEREVAFVVKTIETVADPRLIKLIVHGDDVVGFILAFPELKAAIRRSKGRLFPFGMIDLLIEMRRTPWVSVTAAGILPEFQGHGGNALLYSQLEKTVTARGFRHLAFYQVAETAVQMRRDLINLGGEIYKNHRVFTRAV